MAIRKIARMGHPVLLQQAEAVADPSDPEIRRLIADMIETMHDAGGAGLAGPQVYLPLRLFVFHVPQARASGVPGDEARGVEVVINPVVTPLGEDIAAAWEGCLSIPGLRGRVPRPARIRYQGIDANGGLVDREATGFHALVVQHETDHLDGILYPMRMTDFGDFGFTEELERAAQR
jgi:peptide deformylase